MKWYFALNEHGTQTEIGLFARLAVQSAHRFTDLAPTMLYLGARNAFTAWMERHDVRVIDVSPDYLPSLHAAIAAGWYPAAMTGHWLRTEVCRHEFNDTFVLYTDADIVFRRAIDLSGLQPRAIAAAPEFGRDDWSYFNSGTMILNVPALRDEYPALVALIERKFRDPSNGIFRDQHVFNEFYAGRWDRLDPVYNWKPYWEFNPSASIFHFHGPKFDTLRALMAPDWDWTDPYSAAAARLILPHAENYLDHCRDLLRLTTPDSDLRAAIETVVRDLPGHLPQLREHASGANAVALPVVTAPQAEAGLWAQTGPNGWRRAHGLASIHRESDRASRPWLAALRGPAASLTDPTFLRDSEGRIRAFADDQAARDACDAALDAVSPIPP